VPRIQLIKINDISGLKVNVIAGTGLFLPFSRGLGKICRAGKEAQNKTPQQCAGA
jgi:hypothetical protein|tara:strand:+ start:332 stop:496 length:165 start_codon:yes stop_codon:yes gene_type:complete